MYYLCAKLEKNGETITGFFPGNSLFTETSQMNITPPGVRKCAKWFNTFSA
jgi:hypothetical protein